MEELQKYLENVRVLLKYNDTTNDKEYFNHFINEINQIIIENWVEGDGYELTHRDISSAKNRAIIRKNQPRRN